MSLSKEREILHSEILAYCSRLVLNHTSVTLCETETAPKQKEFLYRVLVEEIENRERSCRPVRNRAWDS